MEVLTKELTGQMISIDQRKEIAQRWRIWKEEKAKRLKEDNGNGVSSVAIFEAMNQLAPKDAVMCVDVGNNAYSFGRYFETEKHDFLMSGYLGSIGFALPASMGAYAAVGNSRSIIAVAGDGGFCQYLAEITTLVKYQMPVKIILINNGELGKISKEQRAGEFDVWKTSLSNPNFSEYVTSCGAWSKRVNHKDELNEKMKELFAQEGPALLEVMADVNLI
jgi:pyruvate oxidase